VHRQTIWIHRSKERLGEVCLLSHRVSDSIALCEPLTVSFPNACLSATLLCSSYRRLITVPALSWSLCRAVRES
jgi:hypothetical protein